MCQKIKVLVAVGLAFQLSKMTVEKARLVALRQKRWWRWNDKIALKTLQNIKTTEQQAHSNNKNGNENVYVAIKNNDGLKRRNYPKLRLRIWWLSSTGELKRKLSIQRVSNFRRIMAY